MLSNLRASLSSSLRLAIQLSTCIFERGFRRRVACLTVIVSLLLWPGILQASADVASSVVNWHVETARTGASFFRRLFTPAQAQQLPKPETLAQRISFVGRLRVSPGHFVGYLGQTVSFSALPTDLLGRTIQAVKLTWESSNPDMVKVDEAGRATFLQPGLAKIICHAGLVTVSAPVLVKPGGRRMQTNAEWNADQNSLSDDATVGGIGALADLLAGAVVEAQGGGGSSDFPYDELWSEPRNLVGTPRNRTIESTRMGAVLPEGSNFGFGVPIESLGGRGLGTSLTLYGNTRSVWSRHGSAVTFNAINGWPSVGFSLGFGRIVAYGSDPNTKLMLIDADGTRHYLGSGVSYQTGTYQTNDGTHITYVGSAAYGGTLYFNNGVRVTIGVVNNLLLVTQITDPNGNYEVIAYKPSYQGYAPLAIDYVVDSIGRAIQFQYDSNFNLTSITAPGVGGTSQNPVTRTLAQFDYQSRSLTYNFSGLTVENATYGQTLTALRHVYFPTTQTGYLFSYSDYGMVYNISLRRQMTVDGNGAISDGVESASVNFNYPTSGATQLTDAPAFTQRTESPGGTFNYSTTSGSQTLTFNVARHDSTTLYFTRSTNGSAVDNGLLTQTEIKNSGGTSFAKVVYTYANDPGGSLQVQSITSFDDVQPTPNQMKVDFDYDAYGNVANKREYGYQVGGVFNLQRRTQIICKTDAAYVNAYLRSLPIEVDVFDAANNPVAKTTNGYDDYTNNPMEDYGGNAFPPGHLSNYDATVTVRGNVTSTTEYTDLAANTSITRTKRWDIFGNLKSAQVSCCNSETFGRTEANCWSVPEQQTDGGGSTTTATSNVYDFNTFAVMSHTDADNQTTAINYDQFLRPTQKTLATGATVNRTYNDAAMSITTTVNYSENNVSKTLTISEVYDGWLRVIQAIDAGGGQVNTSYDAMGRVISRTNPFAAGGSPGPATTFAYDALGRMTVTTLPDGNAVQNAYNGNVLTVTDQVNRKIQRQTDGLGRLVAVYEQDASGQLTQTTNYSYNLLDKLTQVNQGGQLRNYKYDAIGRLLYEQIPEQTATINEAGGTWTAKYTYTDFNAVATKKDARGVITTFTYDGLNRLTRKSYNTSGATGVAATGDVIYTYGTGTHLQSVGVCNEFYEGYGYDQYNRLTSTTRYIQGRGYGSSYGYNQINQKTSSSDPGLSVSVGHDSSGRLSSVGTWMSGISYNVAGQVTADTLGNGVSESYGYDANRLQLTTETATAPGGATGGLMNLTYSYPAAAGQSGAGTTAGDSGQLMSVSGTIGGATESAAYTYDDLGRLVTSNQTSNGSSAQRRFDYDRWGNRTAVWDATSGGNQIQSVALEQSGSAPTNRIQSVSAGGGTTPVAYWKFDETSGTTAADSSGNGNPGTLTNGPAWTSGKVNGGLSFDGVNDTVSVASNTSITNITNNFTLAFWVKPQSTHEIDAEATSGYGGVSGQRYAWGPAWYDEFSGHSGAGVSVGTNGVSVYEHAGNYMPPLLVYQGSLTGWTHVAVVYENRQPKLYINGTLVRTGLTSPKSYIHVTPAQIGGMAYGYLSGQLDEVRVYSQALSASQVLTLSQSNSAPNYTYDSAGNVSNDGAHSYQYDAENRLVSVDGGATAQYWYDHQNRRIVKLLSGSKTDCIWDGKQLIEEHDGNGSMGGALFVRYVYAGSRMLAKIASGVTRYYLSDRLSARLVLDSSGGVVGRMSHLPFGEDFGEGGEQEKHHFTSYERDGESGIDYAVNRNYSNGTGKFLAVDPLVGSIENPQSLNRFGYAGDDPVNRTDPLGLGWRLALICVPNEGCFFQWVLDNTSGPPSSPFPPAIAFPAPPSIPAIPGGGQAPPNRAGDASERLERFLHNHQDCEQAIDSAIDRASGGVKPGLQDLFGKTSFEDWQGHADQSLFELGLASPTKDFSDLTPLRLVLGRGTTGFLALTNPSTRTVYLGWAFAHSNNEALMDETIIHELLHVAFGTHVEIAKALGLKEDGKDYTDNEKASKAVDAWLENDCH